MDLVIRGRSQDQREERGRGTRGGPEWSQAGQDHRAWEDQRGARQDRTRGHGGGSRESPRVQETAAAVGECTPEGARGAGQSSSTQSPSLKQLAAVPERASQPASQPVMRVGKGAQVSSSFTSFKARRWFVYWVEVSVTFSGI